MKEINIDEKKPNHTKAFLGVGIIILFVVFLTVYYQSSFGTLFDSQDAQMSEEIKGDNIKTVLSKTVSSSDKNNPSLPPTITTFLGKWEGAWDFGSGKAVPAAIAITEVVPNIGVTAWYGIETDNSLGIIGSAKSSTGGVVVLPQKEQIIGLELSVSQFSTDEPVQVFFWFENPENRTLTAEFTHPITQQVVKGSFEPVL